MATTIMGTMLAGKALFKYNKKSFFLDRKLKQKRFFQEQDMKVVQYALYREDIRDLVELTVSKMDVYMVASALLIDKSVMMFCKQRDALSIEAPEWIVALNALASASAIFYLIMSIGFAMYASISAQAHGTRLLTQYVRIPIPTPEQIQAVTSKGEDYEEADAKDIFRVPIFMAEKCDPTDNGTTCENNMGRRKSLETTQSCLPSGMLEHIVLYRRIQKRWQAYDAYSRVSLFCGANSALFSVLYWFVGELILTQHTIIPAFGVALIIGATQVVLCRLDLRLTNCVMFWLSLLLISGTVLATAGVAAYLCVWRERANGREPSRNVLLCHMVCATISHVIHSTSMSLALYAAWPEREGDDSFLPPVFKSLLYLDVFGWVEGTGEQEFCHQKSFQGKTASIHKEVFVGHSRTDFAHIARSKSGRQIDPLSILKREAKEAEDEDGEGIEMTMMSPSAMIPPSAPETSHERHRTATRSTFAASLRLGTAAMQQKAVKLDEPIPGSLPWRSFRQGSLLILAVWWYSAAWTIYHGMTDKWRIGHPHHHYSNPVIPVSQLWQGSHVAPALLEASCSSQYQLSTLTLQHASQAQLLLPSLRAKHWRVKDNGCFLRWPIIGTSVVCSQSSFVAGQCLTLLLRRGGRTISVCRLVRKLQGDHMLLPMASLRLASGAEGLRRIAGAVSSHAHGGTPGSRNSLNGLRVYGRTGRTGRVLAFSLTALRYTSATAMMAPVLVLGRLKPEFEVDNSLLPGSSDAGHDEQMFAVPKALLSLSPHYGSTRNTDARHAEACGAPHGSLHMQTWDMATGKSAVYCMPRRRPVEKEAVSAIQEFCSQMSSTVQEL